MIFSRFLLFFFLVFSCVVRAEINPTALRNTIQFFNTNQDKIANDDYVVIIDFSLHSSEDRFYLLNLANNTYEALPVAHGEKSDPNNDGWADRFSNRSGSHQSSLGFMVTGKTYKGRNGLSLNLHGLESQNSKVYKRRIVIHGSSYVRRGRSKQGMSWGCPALPHKDAKRVINLIKGGTLVYIYHDDFS